ncbi:hypothetical protein V8E36_002189 [Tilletia maclaganii]
MRVRKGEPALSDEEDDFARFLWTTTTFTLHHLLSCAPSTPATPTAAMRSRRPASSRFCQLIVCCGLLLVVPTLLYLSSSQTGPKLVRDPRTGQWYTVDSLRPGTEKGGDLVPVGGADANPALSQGNGAAPIPLSPEQAQAWRLPGALGHVEDVLKDGWGSLKTGVSALGDNAKAALMGPANRPGASVATDGAARMKGPIMGKYTNDTARAELGRATWKFLHTMTLRFPDNPTDDDRETLKTFIYAFSRLYPCGECASHFQALLAELPPQTSSRMAVSLWLCAVHNRVNAQLGKKEFDCSQLDATYDCGCGGPNGTATSKAKPGRFAASLSSLPAPAPPSKAQGAAVEVFEGLGANPGPGSY